ncbi:lysosomal amino acid transporter 1 homolog isoform X1 [Diadema antillarum]|uniref:lysosomal amino acid transporter 1 homolog isoform X1 n=2 Tax=Diadema antillarum TaxID=105358 RepID=UPI003A8A7F05
MKSHSHVNIYNLEKIVAYNLPFSSTIMDDITPLKLLSVDLGYGTNFYGSGVKHENCSAEPDHVPWVWNIFRECVTDSMEYAGFILGLAQILCWIVVFFPQFYENYKRGKMDEAIAPSFLILWMMGDMSNMLGCILAKQLATQLATAAYYILMDVIIISQFVYYYIKNKRKRVPIAEASHEHPSIQSLSNPSHVIYCCGFLFSTSLLMSLPWQQGQASSHHIQSHHAAGRSLLSVGRDDGCIQYYRHTQDCIFTTTLDIIGYVCGCFSGIFYVGSRVPQLIKNFKRRSVEGVSMLMFILTVMGNIFYGASILMEDTSVVFVLRHLPWLVGSLGTLFFDCIMLCQFAAFRYFRTKPIRTEQEIEEDKRRLLHGTL